MDDADPVTPYSSTLPAGGASVSLLDRARAALEAGLLTAPSAFLVTLWANPTRTAAALGSLGVVVVLAFVAGRRRPTDGDVVAAFVSFVRRALHYNLALWSAVVGVATLSVLGIGTVADATLVAATLTALVVWGPHVVAP